MAHAHVLMGLFFRNALINQRLDGLRLLQLARRILGYQGIRPSGLTPISPD